MSARLRKYGVATTISFDLFEVDGIDFRVDAAHATGDTKIMKDEGAEANTASGFVDEGQGYSIALSATEMEAARIVLYIVDTAAKAWLDRTIVIETYGHASAQHAFDLDTDSVAQTGDSFARIGATGSGLTSLAQAAKLLGTIAAGTHNAQSGDSFSRIGATGSGLTSLASAANMATLLSRVSAIRAGYLDKLNISGNVAGSSEVLAIQNNTRVRVIIPSIMERPDSGSKLCKLHLYIYDEVGNMEAPDSLPTITAENENGTSRSGNLGTVTLDITGHYSVSYDLAAADPIEQLIFEWTVVKNSASRLHGGASQVVDTTAVDFTTSDRTTLDGLATTLGASGDGLSAIPWNNTAWDAEVESEVADALVAFFTSPTALATLFWNMVLNKTNFNVGQSGAKLLRTLAALVATDGLVVDASPTASSFTTNITGYGDGFFVDQNSTFENGSPLSGQSRIITGYVSTTGEFSFAEPFSGAPGDGDDIVIFTSHIHSLAQINAEVDNALNTAIPVSPTAGSANEVLKNQSRSAATIIDGAAAGGGHLVTEMNTDQTFAVAGQVNGRIIMFAADTTTPGLRGLAVDITATTTGGKLTFPAIPVAPSDGDTFSVV